MKNIKDFILENEKAKELKKITEDCQNKISKIPYSSNDKLSSLIMASLYLSYNKLKTYKSYQKEVKSITPIIRIEKKIKLDENTEKELIQINQDLDALIKRDINQNEIDKLNGKTIHIEYFPNELDFRDSLRYSVPEVAALENLSRFADFDCSIIAEATTNKLPDIENKKYIFYTILDFGINSAQSSSNKDYINTIKEDDSEIKISQITTNLEIKAFKIRQKSKLIINCISYEIDPVTKNNKIDKLNILTTSLNLKIKLSNLKLRQP